MATRERTSLFLRYREEARSLHRRPVPVSEKSIHADDAIEVSNANDTIIPLTPPTSASAASSTTKQISHGGMEPDWVYAYNELKGDINEVDNMLEQLGGLYAQHLLPSFDETHNTSHLEEEIRIRSHRLTDLLHTVEQKVRSLYREGDKHYHGRFRDNNDNVDHNDKENDDDNDDENEDKQIERMIRRNLQKRFATPLQNLSMSFRKRQKTYLDKLRAMREVDGHEHDLISESGTKTSQLSSSLNRSSSSSQQQRYERGGEKKKNDDHDDSITPLVSIPLSENGTDTAATIHDIDGNNSGLSQTQLLEVENASAVAEQRRREVTRIAANINDLATLVKDIAALVVDQGTVLDRVDYNLEDVGRSTRGATRELRLAERYQRKRHALCCIIVLALLCGLNVMILIVKWTS